MSLDGFQIFSAVAQKITLVADVAAFYLLWNIFYRKAREKRTLIAGGILLLMNLGFDFIPGIPRIGLYIISAGFILAYALKRFGTRIEKTVLAFTIFYGFRSMDFMVSNSIYQRLNNLLFEDTSMVAPETIFTRSALAYAAFNVMYILLLALMVLVLGKVVRRTGEIGWTDVGFLSVLNVVGGLYVNLVIKISIVPLGTDIFFLYDNERSAPLLLALIALLLYAGEMAAIIIFQCYRELQAEREVHFAEREQIKAMKQRLFEAEEFYGSIRRVRHDMKSHMTTMKGLAAAEHYEELEEYIGRLDETIEELNYQISTGNAVTDVIINDRYKKAKAENIRFKVDFMLDDTKIPVFDLGIVLGNLLDNAIEACRRVEEGRRYIELKMKHIENFLLITIENSFEKTPVHEEGMLPDTSKKSELPELLMEHGVGLRNVREIAERYTGAMDILTEGNVFKVTIMLQQPAADDKDAHAMTA